MAKILVPMFLVVDTDSSFNANEIAAHTQSLVLQHSIHRVELFQDERLPNATIPEGEEIHSILDVINIDARPAPVEENDAGS